MKITSIAGTILFEDEKKYIKDTVVHAFNCDVDLSCANLQGADLQGANLQGAKNIPHIHLSCPSEVINQARMQESPERFRKYILTELAHKLAEKLLESGYITETWFRKENSEECTVTLYVKPLIKE